MASSRTLHNMVLLTFEDSDALRFGGQVAVRVFERFPKGGFVTARTVPAQENDAPLREYLMQLIDARLPIGGGKAFNYIIGEEDNKRRLVIYRRRA